MDNLMNLPLHVVLDRARRQAESRDWTAVADDDGNQDVPSDERKVLIFLNGHVDITDREGRQGGAWGMDFGWFDHDRRRWYVGGRPERFVTHWMDLPPDPPRPTPEPRP